MYVDENPKDPSIIVTIGTIVAIVGGTVNIAEQIRKWYKEYSQSKSPKTIEKCKIVGRNGRHLLLKDATVEQIKDLLRQGGKVDKEEEEKKIMTITIKASLTYQDIANYFIWLANQTGSNINNHKLQKLVYYAQAWHLGLYQTPLFAEDFQAWVHGPILPALFDQYQDFRWEPILQQVEKPVLVAETKDFLDEVAQAYFDYDDETLERITCSEAPWLEARRDLPRDEPSETIISIESMKQFYAAHAEEETEK